jgi:hypothetical protein
LPFAVWLAQQGKNEILLSPNTVLSIQNTSTSREGSKNTCVYRCVYMDTYVHTHCSLVSSQRKVTKESYVTGIILVIEE